jgi:hypothetical protein
VAEKQLRLLSSCEQSSGSASGLGVAVKGSPVGTLTVRAALRPDLSKPGPMAWPLEMAHLAALISVMALPRHRPSRRVDTARQNGDLGDRLTR